MARKIQNFSKSYKNVFAKVSFQRIKYQILLFLALVISLNDIKIFFFIKSFDETKKFKEKIHTVLPDYLP